MKKLFILLSFLFCAVVCLSQYPVIQNIGSDSAIVKAKSALQVVSGLVNGRYPDTSSANLTRIRQYPGAQIAVGNDIWLRNSTATAWIMQGTGGSLVSVVTILNDSTILICNINSCDTFQVNITGAITNITILSDTSVQVCGSDILGSEQITNGTFTGSATGWTLGALWNYDTDNIVHNFGSTGSSFQGGALTSGGTYTVVVDVGGSAGTITVALDGGTSQTYNAGAGTSTFTGTWTQSQSLKINLIPSNDFDGTLDNVSVKPVLPNCDTLQLVPTNFPIEDTIYVITPLHAAGDDTIYITQSGPTIRGGDSGYLSTAGYDTFLRKVDTLLHSASNNTDILQWSTNGVVTNWDTLDVVCYGLTNPGDVVWTGTGLVYDVTSANYRIDCKPYISPQTQITLNAADATNPRIDVIGVDSSGNAVYIPGTAAATPVIPQIDPSYQVYLTSILVPALATVAPIDTVVIYDENDAAPTNWTPVTNTGTTTNAANTLNPYRGALSVNVTNINNGDLILFTNNTTTQLTNYSAVVLYLRLKQVIPAAANIRLQWFNGATAVSGFVNITFNKSNITTYQPISVPLTLFSFTNTLVDILKIGYTSNNATVSLGFYLDFIYLQTGVTPSPVAGTIVAYNGLTAFKNNGIDSIRLGGTLNQNTIITAGSLYDLTITGTKASAILNVNNTGSGHAFRASSPSGIAVQAVSTGGIALAGSSSNAAISGYLVNNNTTVGNTTVDILKISKQASVVGAAGNGGSILYTASNSTSGDVETARVSAKLTTATAGSEVASLQFDVKNSGSATPARKMLIEASGQLTLDGYTGVLLSGGVAADSVLVVTSAGIVLKRDAASFTGTTYTSSNGITLTGSNFKLGGTLIDATTTLTGGANQLAMTFNTLAGSSGVKLSSTSTAAAGNAHILLEGSLSGANPTNQSTYGAYFDNGHTGAGSLNYGGFFTASGAGLNIGVQGTVSGASDWAVNGSSASTGVGVRGQNSGTGKGVHAINQGTTGTGYALYAEKTGAATTNIAGYFTATQATNNYAIIVPASAGSVGVGTTTPNSTLNIVGSVAYAYTAQSGTYPITDLDYTIDCTANTFTTTLPTAVGITGRVYVILNSGAGTITVATTSSQTFANVVATPTTLTLATLTGVMVQSNGANWLKLNGF